MVRAYGSFDVRYANVASLSGDRPGNTSIVRMIITLSYSDTSAALISSVSKFNQVSRA